MGMQKTGVRGNGPEGTDTESPQPEPGEDLGLSESGGVVVDDPSGFVASSPVETVQGRRVRPISNADLERAHRMQAGEGVPMFNPSIGDKDGKQPMTQGKADVQPPQHNSAARQKAETMMPSFMKDEAPQENREANQPVGNTQQKQYPRQSAAAVAAQEEMFNETTNMVKRLLNQEAEARNRGDYKGAAQARYLAEKVAEDYDFSRVVKPRKEHPALQKFKANLGLEQVKPASVEWAGVKWSFATTNARIDTWVAMNLRDEGINAVPLLISAGLVGIDDIPLYDFLSVPIVEEHTVSKTDENGNTIDTQTMTIDLYHKVCNCGVKVKVNEQECFSCHAKLDPFDIPTDLRIICAERFNRFLEEEFGPYEELPMLFELKSEAIKDRQLNKDELFPLAMSSQEVKKTPSSQSGDES